MDIKKIILEEFRKVLLESKMYNCGEDMLNNHPGSKEIKENYPLGATQDSNSPWNREEPRYSGGESASDIKYKVVWYRDNAGTTLFKDAGGNLYALASNFDDEAMEDYGNREMTDAGQDEDGFADYEYGDLEIDSDAVENYVNANLDSIGVGKGLSDHEDGMLALVDDEVREEIMGLANFYIKRDDAKIGGELKQILQGGVNETDISGKIVHKDRMMTPTGSIFFMSAMEESVKKIKELINGLEKNHKRRS